MITTHFKLYILVLITKNYEHIYSENPENSKNLRKLTFHLFPKGRGFFALEMSSEWLYKLSYSMGRCGKVPTTKFKLYPIMAPPYQKQNVTLFLCMPLRCSTNLFTVYRI